MEVVINKCFGGFGLSRAAMERYAQIKGITLYPEAGTFGFIYYTVPKEQRQKPLPGNWMNHPLEVRQAHNEQASKEMVYDRDIPRDDSALVQVVKELGAAASGRHAELAVVEIPDGVSWEIKEYDGNEHIAEQHRTWG